MAKQKSEFRVLQLDQPLTPDYHHDPGSTAKFIEGMTADGWELVQIYSLQEPVRILGGIGIETRVYGLFQRRQQ